MTRQPSHLVNIVKWRVESMALLAVIVIAACSGGNSTSQQFLSIGTGGTGGIYYPLGGALASRMSLADSMRQYTAEVTGGSVENVNRVASGEMDMGMSMSITVHRAFHGDVDTPDPKTNLRLLAPLYPNVTHILVARGSSIKTIQDFRGRRVSVGPPGSGTEQVAKIILEAHGLSYDAVQVRYLSFSESADAIRDGAIDAAIISAGYPASAVLDVLTRRAARLIALDPAVQADLVERYPYFDEGLIPANAYPQMIEAVPTLVTLNWIVGRDDTDSAVVQLLLSTIRDSRDWLEQVNAISSQIDLRRLTGRTPIPVHGAAVVWAGANVARLR
jgi:uncharacterized protein